MARRYALVIGIQDYQHLVPLTRTQRDAKSVADFLRKTGEFQDVFPVRSDATKADLVAALKEFQERAKDNDALVYFTGHGFGLVDELTEGATGYLATADCQVTQQSGRIVDQQNGIALAGLGTLLEKGNFSSLVLLLDACHSGLLLERREIEQGLAMFNRKRDYFLITACRGFEQAAALEGDSHSLFTAALLNGMQRENADNDGRVSADRLFDSISRELRDSGQEPIRLGMGSGITMVEYQPLVPVETVMDQTNPYQGLLAFTSETARFFFGRDTVVEQLVQKLHQSGFVPLIGASGSGKSSVVRAGLVPRVEALGWRVLKPMKPGTEPLETLRSLTSDLPESVAEKTLLVVDQFEEVFTLSRNSEEQVQFIQDLISLSQCMRIVVTMRADFVEACLANAVLTHAIQADAVYLGAMAGDDLVAAIVQPAALQGVKLQERLLARILQDGADESNCLPLLEFALSQLWEKRVGAEMTVAAYEQLGGVTGALNAHAEEIYRQLATQKREGWVKQVMLKLVRTGEGTKDTRQRQRKSDVLAIGKDTAEKEAIESVIASLVDGRLVVSDRVNGEDVVDLSHEALMESWGRLAGWRSDDREARRILSKIEQDRTEWILNDRDNNFLLAGGTLTQARRNIEEIKIYCSKEVEDFYEKSYAYFLGQTSSDSLIKKVRDEIQDMVGTISSRIDDTRLDGSDERTLSTESKASIPNVIDKLIEFSSKDIEQYERRVANSQRAAEWIEAEHENLLRLLTLSVSSINSETAFTSKHLRSEFEEHRVKSNIHSYMNWIIQCLKCNNILVDTLVPPDSGIEALIYAQAFSRLSTVALRSLSPEVVHEIDNYVTYIMNYLRYLDT